MNKFDIEWSFTKNDQLAKINWSTDQNKMFGTWVRLWLPSTVLRGKRPNNRALQFPQGRLSISKNKTNQQNALKFRNTMLSQLRWGTFTTDSLFIMRPRQLQWKLYQMTRPFGERINSQVCSSQKNEAKWEHRSVNISEIHKSNTHLGWLACQYVIYNLTWIY